MRCLFSAYFVGAARFSALHPVGVDAHIDPLPRRGRIVRRRVLLGAFAYRQSAPEMAFPVRHESLAKRADVGIGPYKGVSLAG